jgi:acyl-coenzyme A synthetase/AMP-(fatty) acid ligase
VERAAVLAKADESGVSIDAFVAVKPERKASIIAMKRHCTNYLPHYMVPDRIKFLPKLPMTSTDKVDYQGLKRLSEG